MRPTVTTTIIGQPFVLARTVRRALSVVVACLIAVSALALTAGPAAASDGTSSTSTTSTDVSPPPDQGGSCGTGKYKVIASYPTSRYGVQAAFSITTTDLSASVQVLYEDTLGRTAWFGTSIGQWTRTSVSLPGDKLGVANIVKVSAKFTGGGEGSLCYAGVSAADELPMLDRRCYESSASDDIPGGEPLEVTWSTPQAKVQIDVLIQHKPGTPGQALVAEMTNSEGLSEGVGWVGFSFEQLQTWHLPVDNLGVYNVTSARLGLVDATEWWGVMVCHPTITTAGAISEAESQCMSGLVRLDNPTPGEPTEVTAKIRARGSSGIFVIAQAFHADGSGSGGAMYALISPPPGETDIPLTYQRLGVGYDASRFTVKVGGPWSRLLDCELLLTAPQSIDPPPDT